MRKIILSVFLAITLLGGCSFQDMSPREEIAAGYSTVASLADAVAVAKRGGHVTKAQGDAILDRLQAAQNLLNSASAMVDEDSNKAAATLDLVQTILVEVDKELR